MVGDGETFLAGKGLGRFLFANGPLLLQPSWPSQCTAPRVGSPPPLRIEK